MAHTLTSAYTVIEIWHPFRNTKFGRFLCRIETKGGKARRMKTEDIKDEAKKKSKKKKSPKTKSETATKRNLSIISQDTKETKDNKEPKVSKGSKELKNSKNLQKPSKKKITSTPKKQKRVEDDIKIDNIQTLDQDSNQTVPEMKKRAGDGIKVEDSQTSDENPIQTVLKKKKRAKDDIKVDDSRASDENSIQTILKKKNEDDIKVDNNQTSIEIPIQTVKLTIDKIAKMVDELIEEAESQPMGQVENSGEAVEEIAESRKEDNKEESSGSLESAVTISESADPVFSESSKVEIAQVIPLPLTAIKIRNIVGKVINLTVEIIPNKVIVQGIVHHQIFFVGNDGVIHHQATEENFSVFMDIPGVQPGMNGNVTANIEDTLSELASNGLSFVLKTVLEVFVKVTETVQINVTAGTGPTLYLKQVVGENSTQTLVESDLTLLTPAIKIDEIVGSVCDLSIETIPDKVIVQGIFHEQIFFIDTANIGRHQAQDTPFSFFVDIPGAVQGMNVIVQPRIEGIFYNLLSDTLLHQKAVLEFFVKVTENVLLPVEVGTGPLFKVDEFVGENRVEELTETLVSLNRPAVKIREILASLRNLVTNVIPNKLIVQGILHKQIFYIGIDNIEYHQAEDVPFSAFLDINGIAPGDDVVLKTVIEGVFFDLISETELRQKVIFAIDAIVTEQVQLNLVIGVGPLYAVEQVVGENTKQLLVIGKQGITPPVPPVPPIPPIPPTPPAPPVPTSTTPVVTTAIIDPEVNEIKNSQQIIVQTSVPLPVRAIKVKEVHASVSNLSSHVIPEGVVLEGVLIITTTYVGDDNVVRTANTEKPFSILINVTGVNSIQITNTAVNVEDIIFHLTPSGNIVDLTIVLQGIVIGFSVQGEMLTVVTDVSGIGISEDKVAVQALVRTPTGNRLEDINVVTDVSGPGIVNVTKKTVLLLKVGDTIATPTTVVTNVTAETVIIPGV